MDERKRRGNRGEAAVAAYLRKKRYRLLASQYRCRFGEIDLIARSPEGIVCFIEVKTRSGQDFARALESVTPTKQKRLRTTAQLYLAQTGIDVPCRFDVAEVYPDADKGWDKPQINYITDAFY